MTEGEWLTTKLPLYMLRRYPGAWDERKVRLFWCACLRRAWSQLTDEQNRRLVEDVENRAEVERGAFVRKHDAAFSRYQTAVHSHGRIAYLDYWVLDAFLTAPPNSLMSFIDELADRAARVTCSQGAFSKAHDDAAAAEKAWQCDLIREVFGNPFRLVGVSPWLTSDVVALAKGIYDDRAFDRMPVLADALQDAGCDDVNVLDHCREPGEHVRGCWVIDLLLGKA